MRKPPTTLNTTENTAATGKQLRETGELDTGEGYQLCPGCNHENHSERIAIRKAREKETSLKDAQLYLYGHH